MVTYLPIFIAAVVSFVIGMLWYSPALFGKRWMNLAGVKRDKEKKMGGIMVAAFVANLVMAYVYLYIMGMVGYADAGSGVVLGFLLWVGFFATTLLGGVFWEGKPFNLYLINAGYQLVNLVVMGAVLGAML
tara:strand:+ start:3126 stop:3518 length:393 start_codon:yes stop_codon:yes gene_type:complete